MGKTRFPIHSGIPNSAGLNNYGFGAPFGNLFFVQSTHAQAGDTSGKGRTPDAPFATVAYAITQCTADNDDWIIVLPGHVETIAAAAGVALNVAGVTILGLGKGRQRGRFNYTTAVGASFDVTAARCRVQNLVFTMTGFDAITAGINVGAADFTLEDCEVETATASAQAVLALLTTASADRMRIEGCDFHGSADAGTAAAIRVVGGDSVTIRNNRIIGNFTTTLGGIDNATTAATNILIEGNKITNRTASASVAINAQAGTTGQIVNNRLSVLTGTAPIVAAGINAASGNYFNAAAGVAAGTLL